MNLEQALLTTFDERDNVSTDLHACINSHGLYNRVQYVVRLSPEIHRRLHNVTPQITNSSQTTFDQVQAFSTLLHETIHWWQHIGSTAGLLLSLSNPVQSHSNFVHLKTFLNEFGPKKSILKFARKNSLREPKCGVLALNNIVNNYKDLSFFQIISTSPNLIDQCGVCNDPLFESIGHTYYITYANTLHTLIETLDVKNSFLPDPDRWNSAFYDLKQQKFKGYYHGSPVDIFPIGLLDIFEGQARFSQLQYLHFASGCEFDWQHARESGMLSKPYVSAFEWFLKLSDLEWPSTIDSPIVGLFMVVCDITMNAGEGFPLPLCVPQTFIFDNDPGTRFWNFCRMIKLKASHLKDLVRNYSREEYSKIVQELCAHMCTPTPLAIAQTLSNWSNTKDSLVSLMKEHRVFRFSRVNMPIRLLFSQYLIYNRDKASHPEILCWPGAWLAGERVSEHCVGIFERNQALFFDKEDDDGIFPANTFGRDPDIVQETFNSFYSWIVNYDLISQWSIDDGPFKYDYRWLSTAYDRTEVKPWAGSRFETVFGVIPDRFEIL